MPIIKQNIKSFVKKIIPRFVILKLRTAYLKLKCRSAKKIFEQAPKIPAWLGQDVLKSLQQKYPFPPEYGYNSKSLDERGKKRAEKIMKVIGREAENVKDFLELGCWDGMTSYHLMRQGKTTTAIDSLSEGFDERAMRQGVRFMEMDAAGLRFENESFDMVFSFNAFEHFFNPEVVLREAARVVRKGGYIYLDFGPLYMASMGLHAYRSITVPYCQFLFSKEMLKNFVSENKLGLINFAKINEWSLEDYRKLWNKFASQLKKISYYEILDTSHLDLISEYPSCFKSKTQFFDNLIVSSIEVLFKKIG